MSLDAIVSVIDYPMTIVTATADGERAGCLVGFLSQCSIEPTRFMVWVSKKNRTFTVAQRADRLAVHFPDATQKDLAALFGTISGDEEYKFSHCRWHPGPGDTSILDDCPSWFAGPILDHCDGGDHEGFLVHPTDAMAGERLAQIGQLSFQMVRDLEPGQPTEGS
jgi:flavin reductase (DIM6/NTAB) family NADH-FMN oxidoreductase RutF